MHRLESKRLQAVPIMTIATAYQDTCLADPIVDRLVNEMAALRAQDGHARHDDPSTWAITFLGELCGVWPASAQPEAA